MLTALDLPAELLYGRQGQWVRDDGAGEARLGVVPYALAAGPLEIAFVRLPRSGEFIRRGELFGHLELTTGAIPLCSPLDAVVLAPNPDLQEEPGLVAAEPYGAGYLLDLEEVAPEQLQQLLEREAAALYYSRLPAHGGLVLEQQFAPGELWPRRTTVELGGRVCVRARVFPWQGNAALVPDWTPGRRWTVEVRAPQLGARLWDYEVVGTARWQGRRAWHVQAQPRADAGTSLAPARALFIDWDTFTLLGWELLHPRTGAVLLRERNPRGTAPWVWPGLDDPQLMDFPRLPPGRDDRIERFPAAPEAAAPALEQRCTFTLGGRRATVELSAPAEDAEGRRRTIWTRQVWQQGAPWWVEAVRMADGEELASGRLLESGAAGVVG